jgi:hypothetical protein
MVVDKRPIPENVSEWYRADLVMPRSAHLVAA